MDKKRLGLWAPILVVAAALVMLAVSTGTVDAARGGKGGGKPGGGTTTATLTVSPNPAPAGTTAVTVTGSGFKPGEVVWTGVVGLIWHTPTADSSGSISFVENQPFTAGTYRVEAYTQRNNGTWVATASTSFTVL